MNPRLRRRLPALVGGLLDPGEEQRLREKIAADPALARALAELERALAHSPRPAPAWQLPPPGLYGGPVGFGARVEPALSMGAEPLLRLRFQAPDGRRRAVVLLIHEAGSWQVLAPQPDEPPTWVADLPVVPETGERELLLSGVAPGPRGLVLVLPTPDLLPVAGAADPWAPLRAALDADAVPVRAIRPPEEAR